MSAKIKLLIDKALVWTCPNCQAVVSKGCSTCRCGRAQGDTTAVKVTTPLGAVWTCGRCFQANAHTRTRCACGCDRPQHAVEGKPDDGKKERRGRVPVIEHMTKAELRFLRERLEPDLGSGILHIIPQVVLPFPDGTSYRVDFLCILLDGTVRGYEVKGCYSLRFAWAEQGVERFRRAKEFWPGLNLEMWKRVKTGKDGKGVESWARHL